MLVTGEFGSLPGDRELGLGDRTSRGIMHTSDPRFVVGAIFDVSRWLTKKFFKGSTKSQLTIKLQFLYVLMQLWNFLSLQLKQKTDGLFFLLQFVGANKTEKQKVARSLLQINNDKGLVLKM